MSVYQAVAQPANDNFASATPVNGIMNGCSANAAYTTVSATADQAKGSCAANGPNYNVWFQFTATATTFIDVQLTTGGAAGTNQYTFLTLWNAGLTELACTPYVGQQYGNYELSYLGLTNGATYYISVDNYTGAGYQGTFKLCLSDVVNYNFKQGAQDVTGLINTCSANAAYTTVGASPDQLKGSCAANGPNYNVWFKFTATATTFMDVQVITGGAAGTNQYTFLTLWDAALTELACSPYVGQQYGTQQASYFGLTPGATYYISVDNYVGAGYAGSFKLCLSDVVTFDYKAGALDVTSLINTCSANAAYTTIGASGDTPKGSCAPNGPNYNVWFKFTASATGFIDVQVNTGGAAGTNQYTFLSLWNSTITGDYSCSAYVGQQYGNYRASYLGLTPGVTYYISVDNYAGAGYRGSFQLCLSDVVTYNFKQGAQDVTGLINTCSANAAYTTVGASPDQLKGSCAANGPNYNVWFKFTATATTFMDVQVITGGAAGTNQYTFLTLWDAALTELACSPYVGQQYGTQQASYFGLTPGATYYISVDNYVGAGYAGSFKLCLSDIVDYNFYQGANLVTNLNNWCSADAAYTTVAATKDKNSGSCWNSVGGSNRWFTFVAVTPNATIQLKTGGSEGTLQYPYLALWQANGTTEIACATYSSQYSDLSISTAALVVGNTYYVSVDNYTGAGYQGTFKFCVNNIGTIYYSRASAPWANANTWSTVGYGGVAAASFPNAGDIANIQGNDITISAAQQVAEINMDVTNANTSLAVSTGLLTVNGALTMNNPGNNLTGSILLQANGSLFVNDVLSFSRSGGNAAFGMTINSGSVATINKDINWSSSAGTTVDNLLTVNGTGTVTVNRDVNLTSTGGRLIKLQFNNTSVFTVKRDVNFTANAAGLETIELNNTAQMKIARNFVRGGTPFGSLACNGTSTVEYNGVIYLQTFAPSAGSGGDGFTYQNVIVNNTHVFVPQITMGGAVTVNGNLTLTSGVISSTATNILNLKNASATTVGSTSSFIDGPMTYEVASSVANTIRNFPIGKSGTYRPASLSVTHSDNASVIYTAEHMNASASALGYTLPPTVDRVSGLRYWQIDRQAVANLTSATVTLYYGIGTSDGVLDFANLTVVKNVGVGSTWFDAGGTATGNGSGSITSLPFTSFCKMTLGDRNGGGNPLPINLVSFTGQFNGQSVVLNWKTASELRNDYFLVERSKDGIEFEVVMKVKGAGTKGTATLYKEQDEHPLNGNSYYRLKQVDFGGKSSYSHIVFVNSKHVADQTVIVYPNPGDGNLVNINLNGFDSGEEVMISIIDLYGKGVFKQIIQTEVNGEFNNPIGFNNKLASGLYLLVVTSKNVSHTYKMIVK